MPNRSFDDLVADVAGTWDENTRQLHSAASAYLAALVRAQTHLGEQLAALRAERGLTQSELERISGVPQPEISRIERGTGNPTRETIIRLAGALHASLVLLPNEAIDSQAAG